MPLNNSKAEISALNNLSWNKDIAIIKSGKGNGIVILDRTDNANKVLSILADSSKFAPLNSDDIDIRRRIEGKSVCFLRNNLLKVNTSPNEMYR